MNIKLNTKNILKSRKGLFTVLSCCIMLSGCAKSGDTMEIVWAESGQEADTISEEISTEVELSVEQAFDIKEQEDKEKIYVYICGAIQNPGVYEADLGSRLYNIVELAGGMTTQADTEYVNLARTVTDGEQIIIWTKEETKNMEYVTYPTQQQNQTDGKVNINTASKTQLTAITGIGDSRAQAIIEYRESKGLFSSIEDIKKVDGIKDGLFEKIKDNITVK